MVKNSDKPRGRPRCFSECEVLDRAVKVFWAKGYDGATIDDLVAAMGIGRPSLYATFGDKEALFSRALARYSEIMGIKAKAALESDPDIHVMYRNFLRQAVERGTGEDSPHGCMMGCVAPLVNDPRIRDVVVDSLERSTQGLEDRLAEAVRSGQLPVDFAVKSRARQTVDAVLALSLRARVGATRDELNREADEWATVLLS